MNLFGQNKPPAASSGPIPFVTEREFEAEVLRSELPVLVQFTADWCKPCKQIAPEVEALATELEGKVSVVRVDIDKAPYLAKQLRVQSVPTFMMWAQGRPVDMKVGALGKKALRAMIEPFMPRTEGALKPLELSELLKTGEVVPIDTRDKASFDRVRLPGAKHMALEEIENRLAELHMYGGTPVLYCRSGDKTKELAMKLNESGMDVAFLEGGLLAWEADGLRIER